VSAGSTKERVVALSGLRIAKKTDPKPASVSAPGAKKDRTTQAVADLFARLADVTGGGTP